MQTLEVHQPRTQDADWRCSLGKGQLQCPVRDRHVTLGRGEQRIVQRQSGEIARARLCRIEVNPPTGATYKASFANSCLVEAR